MYTKFYVQTKCFHVIIAIIFNENNSLFVKIHHQMQYNELTIARLIVIML